MASPDLYVQDSHSAARARRQERREAVRLMRLRRSRLKRRPVAHKHDFAHHASLPEQLLCASCLGKRKAVRDERLDLLLLKEVEQFDQILRKQSRLQSFERLDTVGDDSFPAGEKPAASDVQRVDGDSMKAITTACTVRTQSLPT